MIRFADGSRALIEVKLGGEDDIGKAADNLMKIADDIDRERTGEPAFLMVVTKISRQAKPPKSFRTGRLYMCMTDEN